MTTTINLRKMLHRKSAEYCAPNPAGNTAAGAFIVSDKSNMIPTHDIVYYVGGASAIWNYNADQDAWVQLPNSGATGTFAAGACGEFRCLSAPAGIIDLTPSGTGTTSTIPTSLTITRNMEGHKVSVHVGTNAGYEGTVVSNTLGANATITVTPAAPSAFDSTTRYRVYGGSLWFMNAGTTAVGFSVYDRMTNTWTARSVTGLPTAWGTYAQLVSTPGLVSNNATGFVNGTAIAGATSTTLPTGKTFLLNAWANYQVRIKSGTGLGQIRTISSNTTQGVLTVSVAWTVTPDATSVYVIEGNDDYFYLLGNAAVAMYRYSISGNSWSTLAPTAARAAVTGAGMTANWIDNVSSSLWNQDAATAHYSTTLFKQNGRYIYSWRGAAGNVLDVYDIAANTWISGVAYGQQTETFTTGSSSVDLHGYVYIQKDATGRIFRFDVANNVLEPFVLNPVPQGTAVAGDKMFMTTYKDGSAEINFLYTLGNTRPELTRWLVI